MKKNKIVENNVLMALIMGYEKTGDSKILKFTTSDGSCFYKLKSDLSYHLSWEELMLVIEQIQKYKHHVFGKRRKLIHSIREDYFSDGKDSCPQWNCEIQMSPLFPLAECFFSTSKKSKIDAVYRTVSKVVSRLHKLKRIGK